MDSVAECEDIENNKAYIIPAVLSISNPGFTSTTVGDASVLTLTCDITTLGPFVNDRQDQRLKLAAIGYSKLGKEYIVGEQTIMISDLVTPVSVMVNSSLIISQPTKIILQGNGMTIKEALKDPTQVLSLDLPLDSRPFVDSMSGRSTTWVGMRTTVQVEVINTGIRDQTYVAEVYASRTVPTKKTKKLKTVKLAVPGGATKTLNAQVAMPTKDPTFPITVVVRYLDANLDERTASGTFNLFKPAVARPIIHPKSIAFTALPTPRLTFQVKNKGDVPSGKHWNIVLYSGHPSSEYAVVLGKVPLPYIQPGDYRNLELEWMNYDMLKYCRRQPLYFVSQPTYVNNNELLVDIGGFVDAQIKLQRKSYGLVYKTKEYRIIGEIFCQKGTENLPPTIEAAATYTMDEDTMYDFDIHVEDDNTNKSLTCAVMSFTPNAIGQFYDIPTDGSDWVPVMGIDLPFTLSQCSMGYIPDPDMHHYRRDVEQDYDMVEIVVDDSIQTAINSGFITMIVEPVDDDPRIDCASSNPLELLEDTQSFVFCNLIDVDTYDDSLSRASYDITIQTRHGLVQHLSSKDFEELSLARFAK